MPTPIIKETSWELAKQWENSGYIEDDILLLDRMNEVPIPSEPRRMNFILIALCTQGRVQYRMDTQEQLVTPGDVIIVSERHVIDNYMASPDLQGLCFIVSVKFFHEIIQNVSDVSALFLFTRNHPVMSLTERDQRVFREYFSVIRSKMNEQSHFRRDLVRTLMLAMFYDLGDVIYRFQEHCTTERRVSWYAKQLCITPKYLSEAVKAVSQRTPNDWIDQYVTLKIRVMLKNTTKTIKEITEELNFPNQSFLGKYFKEHVGMSPSQYRKT